MNKVIYNLLVIFTIGIIGCNPKNNNNNKPKVTTKEALQSCIELFDLKLQKNNQQEKIDQQRKLVISNFKAAEEIEKDKNIKAAVSNFVNFLEETEAYQELTKAYQEAAEKENQAAKKAREEANQAYQAYREAEKKSISSISRSI